VGDRTRLVRCRWTCSDPDKGRADGCRAFLAAARVGGGPSAREPVLVHCAPASPDWAAARASHAAGIPPTLASKLVERAGRSETSAQEVFHQCVSRHRRRARDTGQSRGH